MLTALWVNLIGDLADFTVAPCIGLSYSYYMIALFVALACMLYSTDFVVENTR